MGYAERVLQAGETMACRARLHWILLAPGVVLTTISTLLSIWAAAKPPSDLSFGLLALSMVLFLVGGFVLLRAWLRRLSTEIIVTDRRIILKTGLVGRTSMEMTLDRVESVLVNQGVLGRLLNYGTVVIHGLDAGPEPLTGVAAPLEFQRRVNTRG